MSLFALNAMNPCCPITYVPIVAPIKGRPSSRKRRLRVKLPVDAMGSDNTPRAADADALGAIFMWGQQRAGKRI
jgi:hypothetical protein